ncbi:MAG: ribosome biogenesis GTPase Der [candidate division KSB1 bacterium]|nr:ribosome biogenesis GTPase Der [candidate division KSB1 bacterium]
MGTGSVKKPIVAVVGRPNVGKSTFFNRVIRKREAIVDDLPGVTRDRKYAEAEWAGTEFVLVDTGGYFPGTRDRIGREVLKQVEITIREADVVLFMTDARAGVTALDEEIARILVRSEKPVLLAVNKVDNERVALAIGDFYALGLGEPQPLSAANGRQVGDLLDKVLELIPEEKRRWYEEERDEDVLHLAIVGKPNVGKSSLVNALIGEERNIVTDIPGTTRDSIDTRIRYYGKDIVLVDTAGLRRRTKVKDSIEFYSMVRTHDSIRRSDVTVVLIDATQGMTDQDLRIINEAVRFNKGVIIAVNKWDLIEKDSNTAKEFEKAIRERLHSLQYIPVLLISALTKKRIYKVLELSQKVFEARKQRIPTSQLNKFLQEVMKKYSPPSMDRKEVKINYITQVKENPPVFALFANHPNSIKANYRQYIENQFRVRFDFTGVPLTFVFKQK